MNKKILDWMIKYENILSIIFFIPRINYTFKKGKWEIMLEDNNGKTAL
jgi:hypothetical protein